MSAFDLARLATDHPRAPGLVFGGRSISYEALARHQLRVSELVRDDRGGAPLVAFVASPSEATLAFSLSLASLGVAMLPLHPRLTKPERDALLTRAPSARFFAADELPALSTGSATASPRSASVADDERPLAILASSGTTGAPKLVALSRRAFAASARASAANLGWLDADRWLLAMPFSHAGGISILTRCLAAGRPIVVHDGFDPVRVSEAVTREGVTLLSVVPTMLRELLAHDRSNALARLRAVLVGGAACPPDLYDEARARGVTVLTTYGLTEACSQVTTQPLADASLRTSRDSGLALSETKVWVVGADGRPVIGEEGSVMLSGPTLFSGHLGGPPRDRAEALDTGDRGILDERGRLHVTGRKDDLIITGGENVSPLEVERALVALGGVREALVAGIDDERWGQIVGALVVLDEGATVGTVLERARTELAPHKLPRKMSAVTDIPKGPTGKPDRGAAKRVLSMD